MHLSLHLWKSCSLIIIERIEGKFKHQRMMALFIIFVNIHIWFIHNKYFVLVSDRDFKSQNFSVYHFIIISMHFYSCLHI